MNTDKLRKALEQVKVEIEKIDIGDLEDENPYALGEIWDNMGDLRMYTDKSLECVAEIQETIDRA